MKSIFKGSRAVLGMALLAAAAGATAGTSGSDSFSKPVSLEVEYTDLDLATADGAKALYQRIVSAAQNVCGPMDARSARVMSQYRRCFREAVDGAVEKVGAPKLSALHQSRSVRQASG